MHKDYSYNPEECFNKACDYLEGLHRRLANYNKDQIVWTADQWKRIITHGTCALGGAESDS